MNYYTEQIFITEFIKGEKELANLVITLVTKNIPPELLNEIENCVLPILLNDRPKLINSIESREKNKEMMSNFFNNNRKRLLLHQPFFNRFDKEEEEKYLTSLKFLQLEICHEREQLKRLNELIIKHEFF